MLLSYRRTPPPATWDQAEATGQLSPHLPLARLICGSCFPWSAPPESAPSPTSGADPLSQALLPEIWWRPHSCWRGWGAHSLAAGPPLGAPSHALPSGLASASGREPQGDENFFVTSGLGSTPCGPTSCFISAAGEPQCVCAPKPSRRSGTSLELDTSSLPLARQR